MKWHVPVLGDFCWEVQVPKNGVTIQRKNNSVEALIPVKEGHRGLLQLHVHLGWVGGRVPVREGCRVLMKKNWGGNRRKSFYTCNELWGKHR